MMGYTRTRQLGADEPLHCTAQEARSGTSRSEDELALERFWKSPSKTPSCIPLTGELRTPRVAHGHGGGIRR